MATCACARWWMARVAGGRPSDRAEIKRPANLTPSVDPFPRLARVRPGDEIRVEQVSEQFHSFDHSRSRPGEVRIRIHGVDRCAWHPWHLPCELDGTVEPISARRHNDHLRLRADDIVP